MLTGFYRNGQICRIDLNDLFKLLPYIPRVKKDGYWNWGRTGLARRLLGVTDPKLVVDHINGDVSDNRRSNLRIGTHAQNMRNQGMPKNNTTGYKGVSKESSRNTWKAQIGVTFNGKHRVINLGRFKTKEAAKAAYEVAATKYFGTWKRI